MLNPIQYQARSEGEWSRAGSDEYSLHSTSRVLGTTKYAYDALENRPPAHGEMKTVYLGARNDGVRRDTDSSLAKGTRYQRNPLGDWSYEVYSMIVAIGLNLAIALILRRFEDKEQPKWPHGITLNTVVAILSTIMRALLAYIVSEVISHAKWRWFDSPHPLQHLQKFDSASRGVWGAVQLLFITHKPHIASFGALLVVLSLAIGPFTQQAIRTTVCQLPTDVHDSRPSVRAAHYVDDSDYYIGGHSLPAPYLQTSMKRAIVSGLTTSDSKSSFTGFDCPTGNCTFPTFEGVDYSSIGFCNRCTDITASVTERFVASNETATNSTGYAFELSNWASINAFDQGSWMQVISHGDLYKIQEDISFITFTYEPCSKFINATTGRTQYSCKNDYPNLSHLPDSLGILAANCSLFPCLRNYQGSVLNGALEETLVSTVATNVSEISGPFRSLVDDRPVIKSPCLVDGQSYDKTNFSSVPLRPGRNFTWAIQDGQNITAPMECSYSMPWGLNFGITDFLASSLNGTCLYEWLSSAHLDPSVINCDAEEGDWVLVDLYAQGNATLATVSDILDNLAASITNRMRITGLGVDGKGPAVVFGDALRTAVCTRVNWGWVALPAAVAGLVLILLVLSIVQSFMDSDSRPVWKSSILPLLFHGLGYDIVNKQTLIHVDQMETEAQRMDVKLDKENLDFWLKVDK